MSRELSLRNKEIADMYVNTPSLSMEKIGSIFSISRERVRQIIEIVYPDYRRPVKKKLSIQEKENIRIEKRISKFWKSFDIEPDTDCWSWNLGKHPNGYGIFHFFGEQYAHRVSWILSNGDIGNFHVLHLCDNPACINPSHLYLGTHADNMRDRNERFSGLSTRDAVPRRKVSR